MGLNYSLFQGSSFRINDLIREKNHASRIAAMSTVKQIWPLRNYTIPEIMSKSFMPNPNGTIAYVEDTPQLDADATSRKDHFSTHKMTQVDKLRAEGCTFVLFPIRNPSKLATSGF